MNKQNLPEWVNWIAQDANGCWWGYEQEPLQHDYGWYENEIGRNIKLDIQIPSTGWKASLHKVE